MDWKPLPPRSVAILILRELFGAEGQPHAPQPRRRFPLVPFQEAGVRRATRILETWGGVVIADGVGLGKTYIALALIEAELRRGGTVAVAIPAALRPVWRRLLGRLSRGRRERMHVVSHAQLSRGSYAPGLCGAASLVVIDEAHRFRNPATRRHAALAELCHGARVALLTATPINNGPRDLYVLLRLFLADDALVCLGVPSLHELFTSAAPSGEALRRVLREVTIRRGRAMLGDAGPVPAGTGEVVRFPRRAPPSVVRFEDGRIPVLAAGIAGLELAAYTARQEEVGAWSGGGGVEALVRLGLLKRLESGAAALAASAGRQLSFCVAFMSALECGRLLGPRSVGWRSGDDADPLQLVLIDLVAGPCPPGLDVAALVDSTRRDVDRLRRMLRLLHGPDPKLDALRALLTSVSPERCLVFTEFRDTADAIWRGLAHAMPVARIDGAGAWLGVRPASRGAVVRRFAPRSNGVPEPPARERVGVLIATDVLAEGMNLQDARHVVCYDLPWNPVRIMQRIGRVDRLGSPHAEVVPHLFLPATGLEDILGLTRRLRAKLGSIATVIGDEESVQLLERLGGGGEAALEALRGLEVRDEDPIERLRLEWEAMCASDGAADPPGAPPAGAAIARLPGRGDDVQAVALVRAGDRAWLLEVGTDGTVRDAGFPAVRALGRALQQHPMRAGQAATDAEVEPIVRRLRAHFRVLDSRERAPPQVRAVDPAARIARLLRSAMADPVAALEPDLVARADHLLQRLDRPLPAHAARHARAAIRDLGDEPSPALMLDRIEDAISPARGSTATGTGSPARDPAGAMPDLLALLLVRGAAPSAPG